MKEQWKQGLQWGSVVWLGWAFAHSILPAYHRIKYQEGSSGLAACVLHVAVALGLLLALSLFALGSRWARPALGVTILCQIVGGTLRAASYPGDMHLGWALTFWLPMTLPLLPLLFMAPERPRLTMAFAVVGRWRDAYATLAGWNWVLVAAGLIALNRAGWNALEMHVWDPGVPESVLRFEPMRFAAAFSTVALLWGLSAIPATFQPSTARPSR